MADAPPIEASNEPSMLATGTAPDADAGAVKRLLLFFALVYVVEGLGHEVVPVGLVHQDRADRELVRVERLEQLDEVGARRGARERRRDGDSGWGVEDQEPDDVIGSDRDERQR